MATINPSQSYDVIHTLTFTSVSGTLGIYLIRGASDPFSGTVYYRYGTTGSWTSLSVSGTSTTIPISSATVQIAHDWNKSGNDYMTPSFGNGTNNPTTISMSQKSPITGGIGTGFFYKYARKCSNLISLDVPNTTGATYTGSNFMGYYANECSSLTSLDVPDTSSMTSCLSYFMYLYASNSPSIETLEVPDTSNMVTVGNNFLSGYALNCSSIKKLKNVDTEMVTSIGNNFMNNFAQGCSSLLEMYVPDTSKMTTVGTDIMKNFANGTYSLLKLFLPNTTGWFTTNNVDWSVPLNRLGLLKGYVKTPSAKTAWEALTVSGKTLYTNRIRSTSDVILDISEIFRRRLL